MALFNPEQAPNQEVSSTAPEVLPAVVQNKLVIEPSSEPAIAPIAAEITSEQTVVTQQVNPEIVPVTDLEQLEEVVHGARAHIEEGDGPLAVLQEQLSAHQAGLTEAHSSPA